VEETGSKIGFIGQRPRTYYNGGPAVYKMILLRRAASSRLIRRANRFIRRQGKHTITTVDGTSSCSNSSSGSNNSG